MSLLPLESPVERGNENEPRVVDVDGEDADEVFSALSSETGREVYAAVVDEPRTASDIADHVDSSIQNVRYHLGNLRDAGLVEVADTWYSSRGSEMKVYAPADSAVVVFAGDEDSRGRLREALVTLLGGVGLVGLVGAAYNYLTDAAAGPSGGGGVGAMDVSEPTLVETLTAPPGLLFAAGGTFVLLVAFAYWYAAAR